MDFFNHPYYVTIKNINCVFGAWPYQTQWKNTVCRCVIALLIIIQMTGQVICFVIYMRNEESLIELIVTILTAIFVICKFINNMFKMKTMMKLLESIKENQNMYTKEEEKHILDEEAQKGRLFVHGYLFITYLTLGLYVSEPLTSYFANIIFYSNYTLPHIYPVPIHWYVVDMDKNFYPIWGLESICVVAIITSGLASDSSFFVFLQHARGLFILVQYQFRNLPNRKDLEARWNIDGNLRKTNDVQYDYYIMCIKHHKRAVKFASYLESMYVWCFGLVIGMTVPLLSFTVYQLLFQSNSIQRIIKLVLFVFCQVVHIFFDCYLSQRLIDESNNVQEHITQSEWYEMSLSTRKLVILVTMRSQKPCILTAGKVVTLGMETFLAMIKTATSYFTVLLALQ